MGLAAFMTDLGGSILKNRVVKVATGGVRTVIDDWLNWDTSKGPGGGKGNFESGLYNTLATVGKLYALGKGGYGLYNSFGADGAGGEGVSMFGETLGPAGEGGEGAAGGFNWPQLLRVIPKNMGSGYQQGAGMSVSYLIAQQQAEEAARRSQEMLGGDTDLINYIAKMQMQNNLRRAG